MVGERFEGPAIYGIDQTVWHVAIGQVWRRGERMIPWRTGKKGTWSLSDRFEEIYLDDFVRDRVFVFSGRC